MVQCFVIHIGIKLESVGICRLVLISFWNYIAFSSVIKELDQFLCLSPWTPPRYSMFLKDKLYLSFSAFESIIPIEVNCTHSKKNQTLSMCFNIAFCSNSHAHTQFNYSERNIIFFTLRIFYLLTQFIQFTAKN